MHVTKPFFEPDHGLAVGRETEMARLDDAGMDRADRDLVQAMSVHGQEFVVRRIAAPRESSGAEWSVKAPLAVIEPGAVIRCIRRHMTIKVAYGPFEPDRRRMKPANRRKAPPPCPSPACGGG